MRWLTTADLANPSSPHAETSIEAASSVLWSLSGRKFSGSRLYTEIYSSRPTDLLIGFPFVAADMVAPQCDHCGEKHSLWLRQRPVSEVQHVYLDGTQADPSTYTVMDGCQLVPLGGVCWKTAREITVTYVAGVRPNALARTAAIELANEMVKALECDSSCALPSRVTSITRQGVAWTLLDPQDFLEQGRTGIYLVDLFLKSSNPSRALARPRVFSPDIPRARSIRRTHATADLGESHTFALSPGDPFVIDLAEVPSDTENLSIVVTNSAGESWPIPQRMIQKVDDVWQIAGVLPSDTRLVPNRSILDFYTVTGSLVAHLGRSTLSRTAGSSSPPAT